MPSDDTPDTASLPFDDPRLLQMPLVFARLIGHAGVRSFVEHQVNRALAQEEPEKRLRCLERFHDKKTGELKQEWVSVAHWNDHRMTYWSDGKIGIAGRGPGTVDMRRVFYCWLPDLERLWPNVFPPAIAPEPKAEQLTQNKPTSPKRRDWGVACAEELLIRHFVKADYAADKDERSGLLEEARR